MFYTGGNKTNPLFEKADKLAKLVYSKTTKFPKHELYGITSQIRRASLSVILNLVEGFARIHPKEYRRFQSISYGSLKETMYLLSFSREQKYLTDEDYNEIDKLAQEISKILCKILYSKNK